MNNEIKNMLQDAIHTSTVARIGAGNLIASDGTVEVVKENKRYYLTSASSELHQTRRKKLAIEFINNYTYTDIRNMYLQEVEEQNKKIEKAENTKYILENLKEELQELLQDKEISIKAKNNLIKYYISYSYKYSELEIYLGSEKEYKIRYAYSQYIEVTKEELIKFIKENIIEVKAADAKAEKEKQEQERIIQNKELQLENFIREYGRGEKIILLKTKTGAVAYQGFTKWAVGKGKEGKYQKCNNLYKFIKEKGIEKYLEINDSLDFRGYTNKDFKNLNWINIYIN